VVHHATAVGVEQVLQQRQMVALGHQLQEFPERRGVACPLRDLGDDRELARDRDGRAPERAAQRGVLLEQRDERLELAFDRARVTLGEGDVEQRAGIARGERELGSDVLHRWSTVPGAGAPAAWSITRAWWRGVISASARGTDRPGASGPRP
jgi:hypothetical protein